MNFKFDGLGIRRRDLTMQSERWRKVEEVYHSSLECDEEQRPSFVAAACAGDELLRREIESLLAHHARAQSFMETPALDVAAGSLSEDEISSEIDEQPLIGRTISHYRLVAKLGSGGMGEVYQAVRDDGAYEKQVAVKLIRSDLGSGYFIARFKIERQIMARLDHPHIARILDAGTTEDRLPYVVMEYVDGLPIDEYCRKKRSGVPERLKLFQAVCLAVQYAHQNLVLHRDLKPGNILVTPQGEPKLLDFGIAKITNSGESSGLGPDESPATAPSDDDPRVRESRTSTQRPGHHCDRHLFAGHNSLQAAMRTRAVCFQGCFASRYRSGRLRNGACQAQQRGTTPRSARYSITAKPGKI